MGDITKIREWVESDEPEPADGYDWPHPPICIESLVTGELRSQILAKLDCGDIGQRVRLVESEVEGGWSEFTVETTYEIDVYVDEERVWGRDFDWSTESAMAAFLAWSRDLPVTSTTI